MFSVSSRQFRLAQSGENIMKKNTITLTLSTKLAEQLMGNGSDSNDQNFGQELPTSETAQTELRMLLAEARWGAQPEFRNESPDAYISICRFLSKGRGKDALTDVMAICVQDCTHMTNKLKLAALVIEGGRKIGGVRGAELIRFAAADGIGLIDGSESADLLKEGLEMLLALPHSKERTAEIKNYWWFNAKALESVGMKQA